MRKTPTPRHRFSGLTTLLTAIFACLTLCPQLFAQAAEGRSSAEIANISPATWAIPYIIVITVLGLGVFLVVLSSKRQDRPKKDI